MRTHTIETWAAFFGIRIVDWDGFRGMDPRTDLIDLPTFYREVCECTVRVVDAERHKLFAFLCKF